MHLQRGCSSASARLEVHAAHTAHATHAATGTTTGAATATGLRQVGHCSFRRHHQRGDRGGILKRGPHHLRRVDDARLDHVYVLARCRVEAEARVVLLQQLADNDVAGQSRVGGDGLQRPADGTLDDLNTNSHVLVGR